MGNLLVKEHEVVVPGDKLADGLEFVPGIGTYRLGENIFSKRVGLIGVKGSVVKVVLLNGTYSPRRGDVVIGKVIEVGSSYWIVDIGEPFDVFLPLNAVARDYVDTAKTDITKILDINDYIIVEVFSVDRNKRIQGTMRGPGLYKIRGPGRLVKITSTKVPRLIGKKGSMIQMIKEFTNCRITVGQNGWVWVSGEPLDELIAIRAIMLVDKEAHTSGLTDRIRQMLEKATGKKIELKAEAEETNVEGDNNDSQEA